MTIDYLLALTTAEFLKLPFYTTWFPIALIAAIAVIALLAFIMMISAFAGRDRVRVWAKVKIYEVLLSIVLIIVFLVVVGIVFSIDFSSSTGVFTSINLVANGCVAGGSTGTSTDLSTLAVCDMYYFNKNVQTLNSLVYYLALRFSFVPEIKVEYSTPGFNGGLGNLGVETKISLSPAALDVFSGYLLDALYTAFVVSQVQLLLLAASLVLFSVLMAIGFIARIFVITRTFGGAMIALGIGLGIIYPLLVCITYGYVNYGVQSTFPSGAIDIAYVSTLIGGVTSFLLAAIAQGIIGSYISIPGFVQFFQFAGYVGMGLVLVPILNVLIVDVFVIDFSQAVGERIDFASLLTRMI